MVLYIFYNHVRLYHNLNKNFLQKKRYYLENKKYKYQYYLLYKFEINLQYKQILYKKKITSENINSVIKSVHLKGGIDLLSIDVDGNELYLLNKLSQIKPRVIIVEYNSKFPPPIKKTIK